MKFHLKGLNMYFRREHAGREASGFDDSEGDDDGDSHDGDEDGGGGDNGDMLVRILMMTVLSAKNHTDSYTQQLHDLTFQQLRATQYHPWVL